MPTYAEVAVGDELPVLTKAPDREQLVKYAAGGGDFNPLHYDPDFPQAQTLGDNIVHGRFKYNAFGQLLSDWLGAAGRVRSFSAQYRGMDMRGVKFTCQGRVVAKREEAGQLLVDVELWTENPEGQRTTTGSATVALDR